MSIAARCGRAATALALAASIGLAPHGALAAGDAQPADPNSAAGPLTAGAGAAAAGAPATIDPAHEADLPVPSEVGPQGAGTVSKDAKPPSKSDMAYGAFQRGFYLTARKLAESLANLGDPAAQTLLGEIYSRGLGVAQDMKKAAHWYKAAASAGSVEGQFRYAMLLLDGTVVPQDVAKARDLMKAAAEAGVPLAEYNYGQMLIQAAPSGGFKEAEGYFEKAANAGVPDAQYAMSQLYAYGKGVTADLAKARAWLRAAAVNGFMTAQIEYGIWLINGKGGEAKPRQGFLFLKRAAERGNPIAINRLAHLYKDGIGTDPDRLEAAKWAVIAKRVENTDPMLDDFFRGLDAEMQKKALELANRFHSS